MPKFSTCYESFIGLLFRNSFLIIQYRLHQYLAPNFKRRKHNYSVGNIRSTLEITTRSKDIAPEMFDTDMHVVDLCKNICFHLELQAVNFDYSATYRAYPGKKPLGPRTHKIKT